MLRISIFALTTGAVLPSLASATDPALVVPSTTSAWTGTWILDRAASDTLELVLKAQGVSKAKRIVAEKVDLTQKLFDHGDQLDVEMVGPTTKSTTLVFDGKERSQTTDRGDILYRAKRETSGAMVVISRPKGGSGLITVVTRSLDPDGQTLRQKITVKGAVEGPVSATLVFRRAG
ncbi:MAG: hypothetical protein CL927_09005 [Deltaproteobacteria bacterium]|nr:hypothetical protein [Deltaproteobacteria bacterium]HCH66891.1 hypothetical protein [Deltaproteobacteria bacterium]